MQMVDGMQLVISQAFDALEQMKYWNIDMLSLLDMASQARVWKDNVGGYPLLISDGFVQPA